MRERFSRCEPHKRWLESTRFTGAKRQRSSRKNDEPLGGDTCSPGATLPACPAPLGTDRDRGCDCYRRTGAHDRIVGADRAEEQRERSGSEVVVGKQGLERKGEPDPKEVDLRVGRRSGHQTGSNGDALPSGGESLTGGGKLWRADIVVSGGLVRVRREVHQVVAVGRQRGDQRQRDTNFRWCDRRAGTPLVR